MLTFQVQASSGSTRWLGASRGVFLRRPASSTSRRSGRGVRVLAGASSDYDVVIVGGGISGLCTAQALATEHKDTVSKVLVTEARERVGGNITTVENDEGYLWEEGPNSFQPNDSMLAISVAAGVDKDLVFGDPTAPRYVYWDGRLRPTPSGLDAFTFDLMTIFGKIRAGLGAIGIKEPAPDYEESVEQFIRRNLGQEVFERLIEPFCSGVYAGDPSKLGMKAAFGKIQILEENGGSLVGGAIKLFQDRRDNPPPPRDPSLPPKPPGQTVGSFRRGLKMLPEAIAKNLEDSIRVNWKLEKIIKNGDGTFTLSYDTPDGQQQISAKSVGLTAPSYVVADLLEGDCPDAADALRKFYYPPVGAVTISYPASAIKEERLNANGELEGFGQLHPRTQGITTLGTIYSSVLFPNRAPDGEVLLLNYIGGATNTGIVDQSDEELVAQVDSDLRKMLIKSDAPAPKMLGVRVWPKAIPQFNVGHLDVLESAEESLSSTGMGGIKLGGNYVAGVALGKCVEFAYKYADDLSQHVTALDAKEPQNAVV
ncbi:hypothetical protein BSKO_00542 [Bryopsis sp. KO-2023]|nr:hypothetical protein BSKO_00542 [Bryopsis sp. KO-2023]